MRGFLIFDVNQLLHIMAGYAKLKGVGGLHRGVESAPEYDAANEAYKNNGTPGKTRCWCLKPFPVFFDEAYHFVPPKNVKSCPHLLRGQLD